LNVVFVPCGIYASTVTMHDVQLEIESSFESLT